mmetsp:Transcript_1305/g.2113  ORF Transcript_1305/g.2113 Transcript_1305/m.2113 type:complete len:160 (-) Transcript_1305:13-492(-)
MWVNLVIAIGIILSSYALYVEYKASMDISYTASCDISPAITCSKVFLSEYGKIWSSLGLIPKGHVLDVPNSVYGIIYFILYAILYTARTRSSRFSDLMLVLSTFSMILSSYLSYILAVVLEDICVVCYSIYVCNFIVFMESLIFVFMSKNVSKEVEKNL